MFSFFVCNGSSMSNEWMNERLFQCFKIFKKFICVHKFIFLFCRLALKKAIIFQKVKIWLERKHLIFLKWVFLFRFSFKEAETVVVPRKNCMRTTKKSVYIQFFRYHEYEKKKFPLRNAVFFTEYLGFCWYCFVFCCIFFMLK